MKKRMFVTFCTYLAAAVMLFSGVAGSLTQLNISAEAAASEELLRLNDAAPYEIVDDAPELLESDDDDDLFCDGCDDGDAVAERNLSASSTDPQNAEYFLRCAGCRWGYYDMASRSNGEKRKEFYNRLFNDSVKVWKSSADIKPVLDDEYNYQLQYTVYSDLGLTVEEAKETYFAFYYDNPIFYFLAKKYKATGRTQKDGSTIYYIRTYTYKDYLSGKTRASCQAAIEKYIKSAASYYNSGDTCYKNALRLQNKVVSGMTYEKAVGNMLYENYYHTAHNIIGGIMYGKGVCESYAKIYQILMGYYGLDCVFVIGQMTDEKGEKNNHAWDLIRLDDGNFYCVDITWDDETDTTKYFAKGTTSFNRKHTVSPAGWSNKKFFYSMPSNLSKSDYNLNTAKKHTHIYGDWIVDTKVSCANLGVDIKVCSSCGHMERKTTEAKGHDYEVTEVAPTCTTAGYKLHKCKVCDYSFTDSQVKAKGHNYKVTTKAPTCTAEGGDEHICTVCGYTYMDNVKEPLGHSFKEKTVEEVSCVSNGKTECTCERCGWETEKIIKCEGHKYLSKFYPATKTEDGYTEHTCSVCGYSYRDGIIPAGGGNYVLSSTTPATCDKDGENVYTCAETGKTYKRIIRAKGHSFKSTVVAPTCTENGYTEHSCLLCGAKYIDYELPAHGHRFTSKTVPAGNDQPGYTEYTCSVCKYQYRINDDGSVSDMLVCTVKTSPQITDGLKGLSAELYDEKGSKLEGITADPQGNVKYIGKALKGKYRIVLMLAGYAPRSCDLTVDNGTSSLNEVALCLYGDVNGDGSVGAEDISLMQQKLGDWKVSYVYEEAADINCSGKADAEDLSILQQYLAGWNVTLGKK